MPSVEVDRNLLFGVLALQHGLLNASQFADVCSEWSAAKNRPLIETLVDSGRISQGDRERVERWVDEELKKRNNDVKATLISIASTDPGTRDAIERVHDQELRQTLATLIPTGGYALIEDLSFSSPERSRYTLTRIHAEGGLGRVWLARDQDLNRDVALKEIKFDETAPPEARHRFLREAQVTGQLEHPNIVPVYELGRWPQNNQPFYTMRFVRGRTLRKAIADYHEHRKRGDVDPLELPKLLQTFVSISQAIAYAHSRGVIHRDLKPDNVVLGGFGEVLVLDWGLPKIIGRAEDDQPHPSLALSDEATAEATIAGQALGTPAYMAPEQAEGRLDLIDGQTDVYGLGAILYEILTGCPPHRGQNLYEILYRIAEGETPRTIAVEQSTPAALDAICAKAMARDRQVRYSGAAELAEEIQRWLADEPVLAYRVGRLERAAKWAYRQPAIAAWVGVIPILLWRPFQFALLAGGTISAMMIPQSGRGGHRAIGTFLAMSVIGAYLLAWWFYTLDAQFGPLPILMIPCIFLGTAVRFSIQVRSSFDMPQRWGRRLQKTVIAAVIIAAVLKALVLFIIPQLGLFEANATRELINSRMSFEARLLASVARYTTYYIDYIGTCIAYALSGLMVGTICACAARHRALDSKVEVAVVLFGSSIAVIITNIMIPTEFISQIFLDLTELGGGPNTWLIRTNVVMITQLCVSLVGSYVGSAVGARIATRTLSTARQ